MAKWTTIRTVPTSGTGCPNFSAIAGYNSSSQTHQWAVKVNKADSQALLYYYGDVDSTTTPKKCIVNNAFGHAQGMGCSSSYLWIGCKISSDQNPNVNNYILRIPVGSANSWNNVTKNSSDFDNWKVNISSIFANGIGALTFHSSNTLLVRDIRWSSVPIINQHDYDKMTFLNYSNGSFTEGISFYIHIPTSYAGRIKHSQNIFYDRVNGYLYAIYNITGSNVLTMISVYNINGSASGTYGGCSYYNAIKTITINDTESLDSGITYTMIEIESASLDVNNKLLLAGNFRKMKSDGSDEESDRIVRLTYYNPANPTA